MCKCTPNIRTPFCGKPGCEWPEQRSSKQEIARQLREWYESGWIRGNTLKQKQAELLWAAIGSLTADEPSTDQSDIDFLAATLVDQESVLDECEKLLKESLAEDGVECGFDRRLEQYWQKRKALADWRSRELRLAEPPSAWQPIKTAPKDGRQIVAIGLGQPFFARWGDGANCWIDVTGHGRSPSYWTPAPEGPNVAGASSTKSEIPAAAQSAANSGQCESRKAAQSGTAAGASDETSAPRWQRADKPWSEYPIGTVARQSWTGCKWTKTERGWKAHVGDTFPIPGDADEVAVSEGIHPPQLR